MLRFSLFGIPVQVQPWFWLTMAFIGGGGSANTKDALLRLVLFILAGFISILVHELGHALTGRAFGARSAITLQAFGGYAEFSGGYFTRPQHFLVTAAGPFVQILLGVAIFLLIPDLWKNFRMATLQSGSSAVEVFLLKPHLWSLKSDAGYFWSGLTRISIAWAVLNLLPVMPLDGGQMLNALLGPARLRITLAISIIIAVGTAWLIFARTGSILFPLFMGLFAFQSWQALRERP